MTDDELTLDERVIAICVEVIIARIRQMSDTPEERLAEAKAWCQALVEFVNDETW